ncbi:hypothetical protein SmJEL517_g00918 [Synchytrium microbalum]|uniref:Ubiquitinyl hydrolase 1 n=1 Tax=Synchytrium microbalum TaxID=1806994 RepID=A0A507C7B5_9FUNG|nr:uncharacterized protein SmJEL517_g00918 [Synchytrium microbalum]TPX36937.1 hypothetical protein SmJEL517_g00918 [Synchytrium microbalum]
MLSSKPKNSSNSEQGEDPAHSHHVHFDLTETTVHRFTKKSPPSSQQLNKTSSMKKTTDRAKTKAESPILQLPESLSTPSTTISTHANQQTSPNMEDAGSVSNPSPNQAVEFGDFVSAESSNSNSNMNSSSSSICEGDVENEDNQTAGSEQQNHASTAAKKKKKKKSKKKHANASLAAVDSGATSDQAVAVINESQRVVKEFIDDSSSTQQPVARSRKSSNQPASPPSQTTPSMNADVAAAVLHFSKQQEIEKALRMLANAQQNKNHPLSKLASENPNLLSRFLRTNSQQFSDKSESTKKPRLEYGNDSSNNNSGDNSSLPSATSSAKSSTMSLPAVVSTPSNFMLPDIAQVLRRDSKMDLDAEIGSKLFFGSTVTTSTTSIEKTQALDVIPETTESVATNAVVEVPSSPVITDTTTAEAGVNESLSVPNTLLMPHPRHEWFVRGQYVYIDIFMKKLSEYGVHIETTARTVKVTLNNQDHHVVMFINLNHEIIPQSDICRVSPYKVEIRLEQCSTEQWQDLGLVKTYIEPLIVNDAVDTDRKLPELTTLAAADSASADADIDDDMQLPDESRISAYFKYQYDRVASHVGLPRSKSSTPPRIPSGYDSDPGGRRVKEGIHAMKSSYSESQLPESGTSSVTEYTQMSPRLSTGPSVDPMAAQRLFDAIFDRFSVGSTTPLSSNAVTPIRRSELLLDEYDQPLGHGIYPPNAFEMAESSDTDDEPSMSLADDDNLLDNEPDLNNQFALTRSSKSGSSLRIDGHRIDEIGLQNDTALSTIVFHNSAYKGRPWDSDDEDQDSLDGASNTFASEEKLRDWSSDVSKHTTEPTSMSMVDMEPMAEDYDELPAQGRRSSIDIVDDSFNPDSSDMANTEDNDTSIDRLLEGQSATSRARIDEGESKHDDSDVNELVDDSKRPGDKEAAHDLKHLGDNELVDTIKHLDENIQTLDTLEWKELEVDDMDLTKVEGPSDSQEKTSSDDTLQLVDHSETSQQNVDSSSETVNLYSADNIGLNQGVDEQKSTVNFVKDRRSKEMSHGLDIPIWDGIIKAWDAPTPPLYRPIGLLNMGNTCFVSNIIQCLATVPAFLKYFLRTGKKGFQADLNPDNPLSISKGEVATEFSHLLCRLHQGKTPFVPKEFRAVLQKYSGERFDDFQHHDSHEFLAFLLDNLHEDVNKVKKKPYIELPDYPDTTPDAVIAQEFWNAHVKRNQSPVVELFHGMYRSRVTCLDCGKASVKFDVHQELTLEIPEPPVTLEAILVTAEFRKFRYRLTLPVTARRADVIEALSRASGTPVDSIFATILDGSRVRDLVPAEWTIEDFDTTRDDVVFYEFDNRMTAIAFAHEDVPPPRLGFRSMRRFEFGFPMIYPLPPGVYTEKDLYTTLLNEFRDAGIVCADLSDEDLQSASQLFYVRVEETRSSPLDYDSDEDDEFLAPNTDTEILELAEGSVLRIRLEWPSRMKSLFYDKRADCHIQDMFDGPPPLPMVTLDDCLKHFLEEEQEIEDWHCPKCRGTKGVKKLDLWSLPPIVVLHLKRFVRHPRYFAWRKQDRTVDYQQEIDLRPYVAPEANMVNPIANGASGIPGSSHNGDVAGDSNSGGGGALEYELFAVSNHIGTMSAGHYTAFCKRAEEWYSFDDERVDRIDDVMRKKKWGYIFFYRAKDNLKWLL